MLNMENESPRVCDWKSHPADSRPPDSPPPDPRGGGKTALPVRNLLELLPVGS